MRLAIEEARQADYPFGAVIVRDGEVIARGAMIRPRMARCRRSATGSRSTAARRCRGPRSILTSGKPCPMCKGAIIWCHFGRLVYAASLAQLAAKIDQPMIPCAEIAAKSPFAPISITGGVLADEAISLFGK